MRVQIQEYNHQIDRNYGCKVLSMVPRTSPDDEELQKLSADFMLASMKCYVNALKKRSKVFCLFLFISSLTIGHNVIFLCYFLMLFSNIILSCSILYYIVLYYMKSIYSYNDAFQLCPVHKQPIKLFCIISFCVMFCIC